MFPKDINIWFIYVHEFKEMLRV